MTTVSVPKFSYGGVGFRYTVNGQLQAWKVFDLKVERKITRYQIIRDGLMFWEEEGRLLTGWEDNFPGMEAVDWGTITPIYIPPDELPDEYSKASQQARESELIERYSDLANC